MSSRVFRAFVCLVACGVAFAGCSSAPRQTPGVGGVHLGTPQSVSPGSIAPAPMAKTAILPASVMLSATRSAKSAIQGLSYSQIPGAASYAAAAPDGSLWVLSTQPAGPDKYIWHYVNGSWTNISGLASLLAVAPNGTLYAVNSGGGTYSYSGGNWTALGGGASGITIASDGSVYVLSNGGAAADKAIWRNSNGVWSQVPGSGVALAASWDTASSYGPFSGGSGTMSAGGFYILNSVGSIYYENSDGSFAKLPGSASAIAPTKIGGVFVLGYPASASGNSIYYYDLNTPGWAAQGGAAVNIATDSANFYAISPSGGIYKSAVTTTKPTITFGGSTGSQTFNSSGGTVSLAPYRNYGIDVTWGANNASGNFIYTATDATGSGDISGPFTYYTSPGTAFLYLDQNLSTAVTFQQTPQVRINGTFFPNSNGANGCNFSYWGTGSTGTYQWQPPIPPYQTPIGSFLIIPATTPPAGTTIDIPAGDSYIAFYCR